MANGYINTVIVLRNDKTTAWENSEYVLQEGEVGLEILDDNSGKVKMKIGTGDKKWSQLPYFGGSESKFLEFNSKDELDAYSKANLNPGDIAIVKTLISGEDNYSYTSYVLDNNQWKAMDGNYNAENIFIDKDIVLAGDFSAIGNYKKNDKITAGTSLETILSNMLSKRLQPATPTQPSTSIALYMDGVSATQAATTVEVGTTINPYYKVSFNAGSYTYGPSPTGVTATSYNVTSTGRNTVNGATADTVEDNATAASGVFDSFVVDDDTDYKLSVTVEHSSGSVAKDNLGENSNPEKKIASGSKSNTSGSIKGYRAWFCGYKNGSNALVDATAITGAQIRSLGNSANGSWKSSMNVAQMKQMFFAAPAGKGYKPVIRDSQTTAPQTVKGPITVSVEGANGFDAIDYDVWYVSNADAASGTAVLNITKV